MALEAETQGHLLHGASPGGYQPAPAVGLPRAAPVLHSVLLTAGPSLPPTSPSSTEQVLPRPRLTLTFRLLQVQSPLGNLPA